MNKTLIPVLCGTNQIGIQIILNSMVAFFSAAGDMVNSMVVHNEETDEDDLIGYDESLAPSLFVFKTIAVVFLYLKFVQVLFVQVSHYLMYRKKKLKRSINFM